MLLPLLVFALQTTAAAPQHPSTLAQYLSILNGQWTVTAVHSMAGAGKTDTLLNNCAIGSKYYSCEQIVNGQALALIVFTGADAPGQFHTQIVLPTGYSTGRADLKIEGDHWTYLGKSTSDDGKTSTWYRTENFFTGRDRIRFEQYESSDGTTWKKTNEGSEVRANAQ